MQGRKSKSLLKFAKEEAEFLNTYKKKLLETFSSTENSHINSQEIGELLTALDERITTVRIITDLKKNLAHRCDFKIKNGFYDGTKQRYKCACGKSQPVGDSEILYAYRDTVFIILKLEGVPMKQISELLNIPVSSLYHQWGVLKEKNISDLKKLKGTQIEVVDQQQYVKSNSGIRLFEKLNEYHLSFSDKPVSDGPPLKFKIRRVCTSPYDLKALTTVEWYLLGVPLRDISSILVYDSIAEVEHIITKPLSSLKKPDTHTLYETGDENLNFEDILRRIRLRNWGLSNKFTVEVSTERSRPFIIKGGFTPPSKRQVART